MLRRLAFHDLLLIAVSVIVIVLSLWPKGPNRQTIRYRDDRGQVQQYSLPTDDPRLVLLADQLRDWKDEGLSDAVAVARWRNELAGFYAQHTPDRQTEDAPAVVPVSFEQPVSPTARQITPDTSQYWRIAQHQAQDEIQRAEQQLAARHNSQNPTPIEMGKIVPARIRSSQIVIASLFGLIVALGFLVWSCFSPTIFLQASENQACENMTKSDMLDWDERFESPPLRLEIPAKWVRVRQPLSVQLRRVGYLAIVSMALVSVAV